jgi:hypothetical protein
MIAVTWEIWKNLATGLGTLLTGLAATFGVIAAYFRFRRSHEARVNISIELTPRWLLLDAALAVAVRVDVENDGGRHVVLLAGSSSIEQLSSRIGLYALRSTPSVSAAKPVSFVHWARHPGRGTRLLDRDATLAAGDSWHGDFAFVVPEGTRLALVSIELQVRETSTWWSRNPPAQFVSTDVVTGPNEWKSDGTAKTSDARVRALGTGVPL